MLPTRYAWQERENKENGHRARRAIFASPRVGKSLATTDGLVEFLEEGSRGVVIAPLTVCPQWVTLLADAGLRTILGYGRSAESINGQLKASRAQGEPVVIVLSDSLLSRTVEALLRWLGDNGAVVVDESHRFAGVSTKRGRAMRRLAWKAAWVRLLSGTPVPNHAGNLWGQMVALDKTKWGTSYEKFAQEFLIRHSVWRDKVLGVQTSKQARLREMLVEDASIIRREDVFGPDTWQTVVREIDLPPKARKQYDTLAKKWVLDDPNVKADNVAVRLLRLQQITSGSIPDEDGTSVALHDAKIQAVIADLDEIVESGEKAVIFYRFVEEGNRVVVAIEKRFPETKVLRLGGGTSTEDRELVFKAVAEDDDSVIAVVQLQAGGVGRSFAEATHVMFLSEDFSFAAHEQARDRVYKPGERRVATSYRCRNTVDAFIGKVLERKGTIHEAVRNADRREMIWG